MTDHVAMDHGDRLNRHQINPATSTETPSVWLASNIRTPNSTDLVLCQPRYPAEPRCYPGAAGAQTNPAAPLTPYIYNGVAGWVGATTKELRNSDPADHLNAIRADR